MKKLAVFATAALAIGVANADVVLWEWNGDGDAHRPEGLSGWASAVDGSLYYNAKSQRDNTTGFEMAPGADLASSWSAYKDKEWRITYDVFISAEDLENENVSDDILSVKTVGVTGKLETTNVGSLIADTWNTITYTGKFTEKQLKSGFLFTFDGNKTTSPVAGGYKVDNIRLEAIPEPATLGLFGLVSLGLVSCRRRFM